MINLLGKSDFNEPDKVLEAVVVIQKNVNAFIGEFSKKLDGLAAEFKGKVERYNLASHSLDAIIGDRQEKDKEKEEDKEKEMDKEKEKEKEKEKDNIKKDSEGHHETKKRNKATSSTSLPPLSPPVLK